MTKENLCMARDVVLEQERQLVFETFTADTAWDLGSFLVKRVKEKGIDLAISIKKINGNTMFHYQTSGTGLINEKWMNRKFQTVITTEKSSLRAWIDAEITGEDAAFNALDPEKYVFIGGGFPIRLRTGEFVGVLTVSNLPHQEDHQFVADALVDYLHFEETDLQSVCPYFE